MGDDSYTFVEGKLWMENCRSKLKFKLSSGWERIADPLHIKIHNNRLKIYKDQYIMTKRRNIQIRYKTLDSDVKLRFKEPTRNFSSIKTVFGASKKYRIKWISDGLEFVLKIESKSDFDAFQNAYLKCYNSSTTTSINMETPVNNSSNDTNIANVENSNSDHTYSNLDFEIRQFASSIQAATERILKALREPHN